MAANSSGETMPFCCKSASRSILANMSISWAVSPRSGSSFGEAGGRRRSGGSPGAPSIDTMGKLETLTVPYWLVKVSDPWLPCCWETPLISWSSES